MAETIQTKAGMAGMLEGVKVLDFTANAAGPCCTAMMADYGAEIIKIERPNTGNDERTYGIQVDGTSLLGAWLDRGKKSVTLDLKDPDSIAIIKKIVKDVDVIVESGRPGVMDKLGLGYETLHEINPKAVYCSVSAFGQNGPYSRKPGYDLIAQAMSGIMDICGEKNGPPVKSGTTLSDYVGAINAFGSIVTALRYAEKTGIGQHVDVSLLMTMVYLNGAVEYLNVGQKLTRSGNHHSTLAPYGLFEGNNGQSIVLAVISPKLWASFCQVMGKPEMIDDPKFCTLQQRRANAPELIRIIEDWLKSYDDISVPAQMLDKAGIPSAKVFDQEDVWNDAHIRDQGYLVDVPTPNNVTSKDVFTARGCIAKFSETPGEIKQAPYVGENNVEVLGQYGMSEEEVEKLMARWKK
ncbi:MAG: CoA transferase [Oscillospiraceae bacterium]|nr:CoA transferase [Oscillospiraceae bacterium]